MFNQKIDDSVLKVSTSNVKIKVMTLATLVFGALVFASAQVFAASDIVAAASAIITDLQTQFLAVSTAAATVGIACGAFLKKFSLGKGDRIETGNKLIVNSIWGWVLLNGAAGILEYVGTKMS